MPACKHYDFVEMAQAVNQPGLEGKVATHHMKLYDLVMSMSAPVVVEFGVDRGRTTCLFATACEHTGGHLYSLDIVDCSDAVTSDAWTFIRHNDLDQAGLLAKIPTLSAGIDLLHIDTIHDEQHVSRLLMTWFPLVKQNGYITFHDVDATPYLAGQRKNNPVGELNLNGVARAVRCFFVANEEHLFLEFHFGSTGMAIMHKLSPLGTLPLPPARLPSRELNVSGPALYWTLRYRAVSLARRIARRIR